MGPDEPLGPHPGAEVSPGRSIEATRVEVRCPDPSANPYLAFAAMLAAGLDSVEKNMRLADPVEESLYAMEADSHPREGHHRAPWEPRRGARRAREGPGHRRCSRQPRLHHYLEAKRDEWDEYRTQVSGWELDRYLEAY